MQDKKEFDQKEYIIQYKKEHYSTFKVDLLKEEKKEFDNVLKHENITKVDFLRNSIFEFKKERKIKMNRYDVINFIKQRKVEKKDFETQKCSVEGYAISNGDCFEVTELNDDNFILINVYDIEDKLLESGYISKTDCEALIKSTN